MDFNSENYLLLSTKECMSVYNKASCTQQQKGNIRCVGGSESKWAVRLFTAT